MIKKMQTLKNIQYKVERKVENEVPTTICTIKADLSYILGLMEKASIERESDKLSFDVKLSREVKIFAKCLAHLGFSIENPVVLYVAKITLHESDKDDPKLADKIVRDKAHNALVKQIADALEKAIKPTFNRISKLENIIYRLEDISNRTFLGND